MLLLSVVTLNSEPDENRKFRRSLTSDEITRLESGEVVLKTQTYQQNGKRSTVTGPLKVERVSKGNYRFTPYGHWKQIESEGYILAEWDYTESNGQVTTTYFPNGERDALIYSVPTVLEGESVIDNRVLYFRYRRPNDTLVVEHSFTKNDKPLKGKYYWSFDARGLRPVPPDWKFNRFL